MSKKNVKFNAEAFLKYSKLGREGEKEVTFEFSAAKALEIAKLELMSRDLVNHRPILLSVTVEVSEEDGKEKLQKGYRNPKTTTRNFSRKSANA